jgi:hypothetical protein
VLFWDYQCDHRVDRVLGFFSSRPNWDPHTLTRRWWLFPPPFVKGGGGTHYTVACGGGGGQLERGDRHCGTLGIYEVLCECTIAQVLAQKAQALWRNFFSPNIAFLMSWGLRKLRERENKTKKTKKSFCRSASEDMSSTGQLIFQLLGN